MSYHHFLATTPQFRRLVFSTLIFSLASLAAPTALADEEVVYRWLDSNGVVHYSERAPKGIPSEKVTIKQQIINRSSVPGQTSEQPADTAQAQFDQQQNEQRQALCSQAKQQLERLNSSKPILTATESGEYRLLEVQEVEQKKDEMQQAIDTYCIQQ